MTSDLDRALSAFSVLCPHSDELRYTVIDGPPASKARPRFGKGRTYTDREQRAAEERTAWYLRRTFKEPLPSNVAIACVFFRPNLQRIDADNMLKHVLDAANGICWKDDSQVTAVMGVVELDAEHPRTVVVVGEHASSLPRGDATKTCVCEACGTAFDPASRNARFCSRACRYGGLSLADPIACAVCRKPFRRKTRTQQCCSRVCGDAFRRGRPRVNTPRARCEDCGGPLSKPVYSRCRECWKKSEIVPVPDRPINA